MQQTLQHAGEARLITVDGEPVHLLGVKVSGDLRGLLFEGQVEQRFVNSSPRNVELVYTFPLPWGAVLMGVDVDLGGQTLVGRVTPKQEAQARYEEALSEGDAAILLEKNPDRSYSLSLGNLNAGEHCTITLRYAQTLAFEQGGLRLMIPTVIAPRYGNAERDAGLAPHQTIDHDLAVEHPFELTLKLHGDLTGACVASPSHPIGLSLSGAGVDRQLTVSLSRRAWLDRDFVLVLEQLVQRSLSVGERDFVDPTALSLMVSICPHLPRRDQTPTAVKVLVDCSGSMAGDSILAARRALQAVVQSLGEGDRFSLSRFGSTVHHRSRGLWKAGPTTRLAAQRWIGDLEADLGGTEMGLALTSTFGLSRTVQSDVLLVTDGEVHAIDAIVESARHAGYRIFAVGIGSSPAESHLRRLAEATGGACDFVAPGEAVEPAVLRMFNRLRSLRLESLSLVWPEGVAPAWSSPLPASVFDGDTVTVFAQLPPGAQGEVRLVGRLDRRSVDASVPGSVEQSPAEVETIDLGGVAIPSPVDAAGTLSRMAMSARLRAFDQDPVTGSIVSATDCAVDYQLVTDKTHFLLVHQRGEADKATEMPELHKVAQMVPAGWGGTGSTRFSIRRTRETGSSAGGNPGVLHQSVASYSARIPSVWRRRDPSPRFGIDGRLDTIEIPAFLRRQADAAPKRDPRHWCSSERYSGLSPLGLSDHLRNDLPFDWPKTYQELLDLDVGAAVVDWLRLVVALSGSTELSESAVVLSFSYLMSRTATHRSLLNSAGLVAAIKARLASVVPGDDAFEKYGRQQANLALVEQMARALEGMSATDWPEAVLSLEFDLEAFGEEAKRSAST
jgi:Ca-activated chloride channel homolog